ncbi:MAG: 5-methyltetrahydropteroyltriglutamate--homocysteine S-methyltransferase [Chloroflexi bacterium]|nr:5-methyltetrahydropteroyltriglutamate--homocysteine S-methyltransferase [Chloroflexota bacterium]
MVIASNLGYPRIGPGRELKKALESFWGGRSDAAALDAAGATLRRASWELQRAAGIDQIPSNDFSLYDHVLDTAAMLGAVPSRFGWNGAMVDRDTYFAMARGGPNTPAMEMTKWFDTNYHYIVPEFEPGMIFRLASSKAIDEYREAKALGIETRPKLLGPVSFLLLGKSRHAGIEPLDLLDQALPVYEQVLRQLAEAGATWVQVDEPMLVLDLSARARAAYAQAYARLSAACPSLKFLLATYFGDPGDNLETALELPVAGLHLDLTRASHAGQLVQRTLAAVPDALTLSLGLVDGRNVWRTDLDAALGTARAVLESVGSQRVMIGPSCSLLHTPVDLGIETELDEELCSWLAFARQKVDEIALLARALVDEAAVAAELEARRAALASRRASSRVHDPAVAARMGSVDEAMQRRVTAFAQRQAAQQARLRLPLLPTTTIGSFPQTGAVRKTRAAFKAGRLSAAEYDGFLESEIERVVRFQEEVGLDVLVHGEPERTDMVEYFGERLSGVAVTKHGWVQSYGSRCARPPIIYGDVSRPEPMTVRWARYAQSLTDRPVKGMLTGPITILQWSFVRDDQPRRDTAGQIALAIRDEVRDLEAAGIRVIQIDEPALREGLPLRRAQWAAYLEWAVASFRLVAAGVRDETQIHTHMCYAEFNDILEAIARMDADVISIEASRSQMELLEGFARFRYPNQIGPGVYDIHSPRVPSQESVETLIDYALDVLAADQLWINPDCGLKTRNWDEVRPSLMHMVAAAERQRSRVTAS